MGGTDDESDPSTIVTSKLKESLGKEATHSVKECFATSKKAKAETVKQEGKVSKYSDDLSKIDRSCTPNGYKPFRCGPGPALFDDPCGDASSLTFTLSLFLLITNSLESQA